MGRFLCIAAIAIASVAADPAANSVHIGGNVVSPTDWTIQQLQSQLAAEIKPIQYNSRGSTHTFNCVPLVAVLKAAGAPTDFAMQGGAKPTVKNPQMRMAVVVRGRDGYTVVFSLAEVLPMVGNRAVWVALDEDGKPLPASDGPVRLIVPEDQMPARGVHEVQTIDLVDVTAPATQPVGP